MKNSIEKIPSHKALPLLSSIKVTHIDKEEFDRKFVELTLEHFKIKCQSYPNLEAAIPKLRYDPPSLIITDWIIKDQDAFRDPFYPISVIKSKYNLRKIPIIVLSDPLPANIVYIKKQVKKKGVKYWLDKPLDPNVLPEIFEKIFLSEF